METVAAKNSQKMTGLISCMLSDKTALQPEDFVYLLHEG